MGDNTWWRIQEAHLARVGARRIWVVSDDVRSEIEHGDDAPSTLVSAAPDAPMFSSVLAGLRKAPLNDADGLFVLPVDTPVPSLSVWEALVAFDALRVPTYRGTHGHPVFLPSPWVRSLLTAIDAGKLDPASQRLDTLIAPTVAHVAVDDPAVCTNLNTAADFHAYLTAPPRPD
jgi:CTP:molybdopterin cytidylyltransferase MocA